MKTTRTYRMDARAEAVAQTRERILRALFDLGADRMFPDISLDDIATEAGVSVQTILRHFGTRVGLVEATMGYAIARVTGEREAPVGDVDAAVGVIVDHYEQRGTTALLMLAQEHADPAVGELTRRGRQMHRTWVTEVFAPFLPPGDDAATEELVDLLVVATDVYTWKILRHDRRLSRARTEARIHRLVSAVLATSDPKEAHP
jgi:AcrR family transcriptional regulator